MARLLPPFRFGIVEKGVFRGACPTPRNYAFLRSLQLRTIVSLLPGRPPGELEAFCKAHGVQALHYEVPKFKGDVTLAPYLIAELLELLVDAEHHPVYVHCLDGGNNTGMLIACLRKLQNWSTAVIGAEFSRFVKAKDAYISADEQDFIDAFRAAVRLPPRLPPWLWHGAAVARHPTIPLKLAPALVDAADADAALSEHPLSRPLDGPRRVLSPADAASLSLQALDMAGFARAATTAPVPLTDFTAAAAAAAAAVAVSAPPTPLLSRHAPSPAPSASASASTSTSTSTSASASPTPPPSASPTATPSSSATHSPNPVPRPPP